MNKMINAATLSLSLLACLAAVGCVASAGGSAEDSAAAPADEGTVGTAAQALTGNVVIRNVNSDLALNIFGASTNQGAPLIQWPVDGSSNNVFTLVATPDGYTNIVAVYDGMCLDVFGGASVPGQGINQWSCGGNDHQKFTFQQVSPGIYQIKSKPSGMCLQVFNDSTAANYAVVQVPCVTGKTSQQFYLSFQ